ncbi:MAG: hypothetical protein WC208_15525 [Gallionella sp.]|jgi:hypothetical protein
MAHADHEALIEEYIKSRLEVNTLKSHLEARDEAYKEAYDRYARIAMKHGEKLESFENLDSKVRFYLAKQQYGSGSTVSQDKPKPSSGSKS